MINLMMVLPEYFRPVMEFQKIMEVHGAALDKAEQQINQVRDNCSIQTADEETIAYYEDLLGIMYKQGESLNYRRERVLQKLSAIVPFSVEFLKTRLYELYGEDYELEIDSIRCTISISVNTGKDGALDLLYSLLWDVLPAHLEIIASQKVENAINKPIYNAVNVSKICMQLI
ncbi:MAG: putative phage tail protein [Lachnospiraceae bacterium]